MLFLEFIVWIYRKEAVYFVWFLLKYFNDFHYLKMESTRATEVPKISFEKVKYLILKKQDTA
jgi:hypothetical protein